MQDADIYTSVTYLTIFGIPFELSWTLVAAAAVILVATVTLVVWLLAPKRRP